MNQQQQQQQQPNLILLNSPPLTPTEDQHSNSKQQLMRRPFNFVANYDPSARFKHSSSLIGLKSTATANNQHNLPPPLLHQNAFLETETPDTFCHDFGLIKQTSLKLTHTTRHHHQNNQFFHQQHHHNHMFLRNPKLVNLNDTNNNTSTTTSNSGNNKMASNNYLKPDSLMLKSSSEPAFKDLVMQSSCSSTFLNQSNRYDYDDNEESEVDHEPIRSASIATDKNLISKAQKERGEEQQSKLLVRQTSNQNPNQLYHFQPNPHLRHQQTTTSHYQKSSHHNHHHHHHTHNQHQQHQHQRHMTSTAKDSNLLNPQLIPKVIRKSLIDLHKRSMWNLAHHSNNNQPPNISSSQMASSNKASTSTNKPSKKSSNTLPRVSLTTTATTAAANTSFQMAPTTATAVTATAAASNNNYATTTTTTTTSFSNAKVYTQQRHANEIKMKVMDNYV